MRRRNICISCCFLMLGLFVVNPLPAIAQLESTPEIDINDNVMSAWVKNIYTDGVSIQGDSVFISDEVFDLLEKEELRAIIYPETYTWDVTKALIEQQALKQAFWYMINLYPDSENNKEIVIRSVLMYSKFLDMDKALKSAFYSYCFTDPEIGVIKDGKPIISAPHVLEAKLNVVRELRNYLSAYQVQHEK